MSHKGLTEKQIKNLQILEKFVYVSLFVYIYIYIYTHTCVCGERERERENIPSWGGRK